MVVACTSTTHRDVTTAVRYSTVQTLGPNRSALVLSGPREQVFAAINRELTRRGFPVASHLAGASGAEVYVFRGARTNTTVVSADIGLYAQGSRSYEFGSVFFAIFREAPSGVSLFLFGKPTINGMDACSESDAMLTEFNYHCYDAPFLDGAGVGANASGRAELDVVTGVLTLLSQPSG
jgi:hypothetical protein